VPSARPLTITHSALATRVSQTSTTQAVTGVAELADQKQMAWEKQENEGVRDPTTAEFQKMGFRVADSQTNLIFVSIGRHADGKDVGPHLGRTEMPSIGPSGPACVSHSNGSGTDRTRCS